MLGFLLRKELSTNTKKGIRQIGLAFGLTVLIFLFVLFVESVFKVPKINETKIDKVQQNNAAPKIQAKENDNKCEYIPLICMIGDSKLLGQVQNFAVIAAAWLYFFDVFDRKKQVERQA